MIVKFDNIFHRHIKHVEPIPAGRTRWVILEGMGIGKVYSIHLIVWLILPQGKVIGGFPHHPEDGARCPV